MTGRGPRGAPAAAAVESASVSAEWRQAFAKHLLRALRATGKTILRLRADGCGVRIKRHACPVTAADLASPRPLADAVWDFAPNWPVIGEEDARAPTDAKPSVFVLLDPLDGTRDFIDGRDEFSINVA